jgi:hypothetical protein
MLEGPSICAIPDCFHEAHQSERHYHFFTYPTRNHSRRAFIDAALGSLVEQASVHDRDAAFADVASSIAATQIVVTAPRSPWQNAYVERRLTGLDSTGVAAIRAVAEKIFAAICVDGCGRSARGSAGGRPGR